MFERYCDELIRILPADWTVNLNDLGTSSVQQVGSLPTSEDRDLRFFAPEPEKISVRIWLSSIAHGITLWVGSGTHFKAPDGQAVGELRNAVRSGGPVIATMREKAKVYNSGILKAEMLFHLNRYREVVDTCNSLSPEAWFCNLARKGGVDPYELYQTGKYEHYADPYELYLAGKYEEALVASTVAIQKSRNFGTKDGWTLLSEYQQRALINAAIGQIGPALQDFNTAAAIKASLPRNQFDDGTLELQEAIVLYMHGAPSAGEQACAQAAKTTTLAFLVTDLCERMQKAGVAVSHLEPDTKTSRQPAINARYPNITFQNPSDLDVVIKLIGPSSQGLTLVRRKDVSLNVPAGEYRILLRYTKSERDYVYAKGGPFTVIETSAEHSETRITLPKHPKTGSEAQKQFDQTDIAISERPLSEAQNAAGANGDFRFVRAITGSEGRIVSLTFSRDAHMLAVVTVGNVTIWDVDSGRELWNTPLNSGRNVAFSPDGKFLAREREDGSHFVIELLEPTTNIIVSRLGRAKGESEISFSSDSRRLASGSHDTIQVSDVATGRTLYSITSKKDMIGSLAFSPDGRWLASAGKNGIVLWEAADGKWLKDFAAGEFVAFSPDGQMIASAGSQKITLWNLAKGQAIRTLAGKAPLVFSQDGHWLASRNADGRAATVWNVATGEDVATLGDPSDEVTSIDFSPDGQWLASGSEYDTVWLWRRSSRRAASLQASASDVSTKK